MNATSCYDILGVAANATLVEITAAYQRALQELRSSLDGPNPQPPEKLDALHAAYRQISDPASRQSHDAMLAARARPAAESDAADTCYPFVFTGSGGQYFRIWIVNLFLSIITLGIYSAWAKVRRESYFHGNLLLDNSAFGYHGKPLAILKGRALALILLVAISLAQSAGPLVYSLAMLALLPATPWLIVRAFRFRAHNTSYRGLRFSFLGTYRQALTAFVGYGLLSLLSFGLLFPLFYRQQKKFVLDNLRYGSSKFQCDVTVGQFYGIFLKPIALVIGFMFLAGMIAAIGGAAAPALPLVFGVLTLGVVLFLMPYIRVRTANLIWNHVALERFGFSSTMKVMNYFMLIAVNLFLMLLTLGLFWPWARVRVASYRASCLELRASRTLDSFVAGETAKAPAVGDELSELMDMDIAF